MRSSSSGGFDPGVRLGCVSSEMGGGIEESDESEGVIELTRLASEHGVEGVTGLQLMSGLVNDLESWMRTRNSTSRARRSCDCPSPERYSKYCNLASLTIAIQGNRNELSATPA